MARSRVSELVRLSKKYSAADDKVKAFEPIYLTGYAAAWCYFTRYGAASEADDLAQETMKSLWGYRYKLGTIENARSYFFSIARSKLIDWLKRRTPNTISLSDPACKSLPDMRIRLSEDVIYFKQVLEHVMANLTPGQRTCCMLQAEGYSSAEVARITRLSKAATRRYLYKGHLTLHSMRAWYEYASRTRIAAQPRTESKSQSVSHNDVIELLRPSG